jgi:hypothetical protein
VAFFVLVSRITACCEQFYITLVYQISKHIK